MHGSLERRSYEIVGNCILFAVRRLRYFGGDAKGMT